MIATSSTPVDQVGSQLHHGAMYDIYSSARSRIDTAFKRCLLALEFIVLSLQFKF